MIDPTFTTQFGLAAQRDILRQAAEDRHRQHAWSARYGPVGLMAAARRLAGAFRQHARGREGREPVPARATQLCHSRAKPAKLLED